VCLDLQGSLGPVTQTDMLAGLYRRRDIQENMRVNALRELRAQMSRDINRMTTRHTLEKQNLKSRWVNKHWANNILLNVSPLRLIHLKSFDL